ncbi:hypothetical protein O0235_00820 [Tepidiforma flava]|uniref:Uncharacterized protein n=1 Tax=Tepidiforma flava TaxID=3004094 RepID=A0ABY7M853_9CHLR|nr:hypothetical protein [Tepidiforma flava]WBL36193.1 hypothetical protein O0235_00820 [Tepidiforma flava]
MATRRRVIAALGLGLAAPGAILGGAVRAAGAPGGLAQAQAGLPHRVVLPGVGTDGPRPAVRLSFRTPFQGGAIYPEVEHAVTAAARVFGRVSPLSPGPRGVEGFVGFGVADPPGPAVLEVTATDAVGGRSGSRSRLPFGRRSGRGTTSGCRRRTRTRRRPKGRRSSPSSRGSMPCTQR